MVNNIELDIMKMLEAQFKFNATFNKKVEEIKNDFIKPDTSGNSEQSDDVQKEPA